MKRILLLLDQKENQQLLADELGQGYRVVVGRTDADLEQDFDLCVADGRSLDRLWGQVHQRKAREQPVFLPVLLVTARQGVKMITRQVWRSIDELIISPIEKPELRARIEILLRARSLSLAVRQQADAAERATSARDEVLAVVSHDLRNPLNVILTIGSFLLDTAKGLEEQERQQLQMVHRSAQQMHRLIQDLLEISGMEAGHLTIRCEYMPVEPLVVEACEAQQHAAAAKSVEICTSVEPGLPPVNADRDRILQVMGNLISNALKFTPEGGRIVVSAARETSRIRIAVSDTGPGISAEDLPHVFDRFWQAKHTRDGGAGLGLAIVRRIIDAHGGQVRVESEVGAGSTFVVTLNAARGTARDEA
ncbi:hypothetical protein BH23GEM9_BH23GEM9_28890 [soil metagenome]